MIGPKPFAVIGSSLAQCKSKRKAVDSRHKTAQTVIQLTFRFPLCIYQHTIAPFLMKHLIVFLALVCKLACCSKLGSLYKVEEGEGEGEGEEYHTDGVVYYYDPNAPFSETDDEIATEVDEYGDEYEDEYMNEYGDEYMDEYVDEYVEEHSHYPKAHGNLMHYAPEAMVFDAEAQAHQTYTSEDDGQTSSESETEFGRFKQVFGTDSDDES
jgi:hypothetical protein